MADPPDVTILLLGNSKIGKTTFLSRISQGSKNDANKDPVPLLHEIDQPFIFDIKFSNRPYRFQFYDTSNPANLTLLNPNMVVLCYDISNRFSLIDMQRTWYPQTHKVFFSQKEVPILVLGLKRDLRSEEDPKGVIYPQEAYRVAQEMRCDKYMECSAVSGELVYEVFEDICMTAVACTKENGGQSNGGCGIM